MCVAIVSLSPGRSRCGRCATRSAQLDDVGSPPAACNLDTDSHERNEGKDDPSSAIISTLDVPLVCASSSVRVRVVWSMSLVAARRVRLVVTEARAAAARLLHLPPSCVRPSDAIQKTEEEKTMLEEVIDRNTYLRPLFSLLSMCVVVRARAMVTCASGRLLGCS